MENSKIEWCHHTFNHIIGCARLSPGCARCYAEADMDKRRGRVVWGVNGTRSVTSYSYWRQPLKWNKEAAAAGERRRVFCASLADVFEDWKGQVAGSKGEPLFWPQANEGVMPNLAPVTDVEGIPAFAHQTVQKEDYQPLTLDIIRSYLFWLIERTPNLDWLLLTKRPENIMKMVPLHWKQKFPANVWMGTSVENQKYADERIPYLLKVPAVVRFLSMEPLLGPVDLKNIIHTICPVDATMQTLFGNTEIIDALTGERVHGKVGYNGPNISWTVCGGESGHNARPMHPAWARSLRDQCVAAGVAFHFKQYGQWGLKQDLPHFRTFMDWVGAAGKWMRGGKCIDTAGNILETGKDFMYARDNNLFPVYVLFPLGKKEAGRLLDGRTWDELPTPTLTPPTGA